MSAALHGCCHIMCRGEGAENQVPEQTAGSPRRAVYDDLEVRHGAPCQLGLPSGLVIWESLAGSRYAGVSAKVFGFLSTHNTQRPQECRIYAGTQSVNCASSFWVLQSRP